MMQIAILGSFSGRNKGDLAILRSELIQLKRQNKEKLTIHIFTKDTQQLKTYLNDITTNKVTGDKLHIKIYKSLTAYIGIMTLPVLAKCDKVVVGGGGLFFENRLFDPSFNHLLNIFIISLWLKLLGKQTMIYSVGCSHLDSKLARWMTKVVANNAKIVSVRDELSREILSECADKEIVLGRDPTFLLEPKKTARVKNITKSWPTNKIILLSLHKHIFLRKNVPDHENTLKQFLGQVVKFANEKGCIILTYTNYTNQSFASKIADLCGKPARPMLENANHLLPEELIYLFSKIDFIIATQMHVGIFAYLAKVPLLSLIYDDKVEEFNKQIGNKNYLYLTEIGDSLKVEKALATTAGTETSSQKPSLRADSEKLINLLNNFVRS